MSHLLKKSLKLALIQLASTSDKTHNLTHARTKVLEAASTGAKLIVLPECFNSPYGTKYFPKYAETLLPSPPTKEQSPSYHALSDMAKEAKAWLIGGSIPEYWAETKKYYNTSLAFDPEGRLVGTHRKVHLFDIDIPGKIQFKESEVLSPGNKVTLLDLPEYGRIGLAICYDIRFPELATIAARKDAFLLLYPGAFNLTTGKLHWELQARARAVDNQVYVGLCSPARDMDADYHAWGHSMVVDPMAEVVVEAGEREEIVYWELEGGKIEETRKGIPIYGQRRFDVYPDVSEGKRLTSLHPLDRTLRERDGTLATIIPNETTHSTGAPPATIPPQTHVSSAANNEKTATTTALYAGASLGHPQPTLPPQPVRRQSTVLVRKRLPWLDGSQPTKRGQVSGQDEANESLNADNTADQVAAVAISDPPLNIDPAIRAVGSTPSLRAKAKLGEFKTLSLSSRPREGVVPPVSKEHAKQTLGLTVEPHPGSPVATSEYSTTPTSDIEEPPESGSHEALVSKPSLPERPAREQLSSENPWMQSRLDLPLQEPSSFNSQRVPRTNTTQQPHSQRRAESCHICEDLTAPTEPPKARPAPRRSVAAIPPVEPVSPTAIRPPVRKPTLFSMPEHLLPSSSSSSWDPRRQAQMSSVSNPPQASPPALPPRRSTGVAPTQPIPRLQSQSLNRAVTGLENLMEEALHVARDAAQTGRNKEVAQILNSATLALRKASTVHENMDQVKKEKPFRLSPPESRRQPSASESFHSDSDSSSAHSTGHSVETVPTIYTTNTLARRQPVVKDQYRAKDRSPRSQKASYETMQNSERGVSPDRRSMTRTPPRLYQPPSADSIVRDFAYSKQLNARGEAAGRLSRSHGAAADYYGDRGQSVATQAGVRPSVSKPMFEDGDAFPTVPPATHRKHHKHHGHQQRRPLQRVEQVATNTIPPRVSSKSFENQTTAANPPTRKHHPRHNHGHHHHISNLFEASAYHSTHPHVHSPTNEVKRSVSQVSDTSGPKTLLKRDISLRHPRRKHLSLRDGQGFSLGRYHRRQPIAREWNPHRKRITAAIACLNTVFVGLIAGIYAGEVPRIQYMLADTHHHVILGNVVLFATLGVTSIIAWPLPLLHGRKPYTLLAFALMLPLMFPQALAVSGYRSPYNPIYRCGLLIPRAFQGIALGFANVNFLPTLFDLFGASLMSDKPHQELVVYDDVRRQGGGIGAWLGIWSFCFVGSMSIGFCIGAVIIGGLSPSWGFYIIVMLLAFFLVVNVVAPETRRAPYRRSIAQYLDEEERLKRRVARGEVKLHISNEGPKWWFEEVWAGVVLTKRMMFQLGFFVMMLYLAWMYAQVTLVILLLGALLSRDYLWAPHYVGTAVLSVALGAFFALPLSKANLFSRARDHPQRTDSMTMRHAGHVSWSSHMLRRILFTLFLPFAALAYTLSSPGPRVSWVTPTVFCGLVGFLSNLAIAECVGLLMETFDTCDLQPGVNQKHRLQSMQESTRRRRTNYSSFPRVCAGFFAAQGLGFILSAAATGVSGDVTRAVGAQTATAIVASILLALTVGFIAVLWRWRELQVIPTNAFGFNTAAPALGHKAEEKISWGTRADGGEDTDWRPVIIGNPSGKMRRMSLLEMGALSRWTEIRLLNKLVKS